MGNVGELPLCFKLSRRQKDQIHEMEWSNASGKNYDVQLESIEYGNGDQVPLKLVPLCLDALFFRVTKLLAPLYIYRYLNCQLTSWSKYVRTMRI